MATTFKPLVVPTERKRDGTWRIKIRLTHNRKTKRISTHLFALQEDLVRGTFEIKNREILDELDVLIKEYRDKVKLLGRSAEQLTVDQVFKFIMDDEDRVEIKFVEKTDEELYGFKLDFIEFGRKVADSKNKSTGDNYHSSLNCLERFIKKERGIEEGSASHETNEQSKITLDISEVTAKFLEKFEAFIASEPVLCYSRKNGLAIVNKQKKGRALTSYMANIRHIHNRAKWEYNDEDEGIIRIPQSPFAKYKMKKAPKAKPRPISIESIQTIIDLPDFEKKDGPPKSVTRRDLARDCFLISFALAGINAADLYDCEHKDFDRKSKILTYGRKKTRNRREDGAVMKIKVEDCIMPLILKYITKDGNKLFKFSEFYSSPDGFNNALKYGIGMISNFIPEKEFVFYSARYSWATIGRSEEVSIDKYTIHEGLNHVDEKMKVTDGYIQRDFRPIWTANQKILNLFNWAPVERREKARNDVL